MEPSRSTQRDCLFRFGPYELSERDVELRKNGVRIKLQDQPFRLLVELVANPGKVIGRAELQQKLWPADTFVDFDVGLNNAIRKLREALGDDADQPRYIETLAKRGYRFLAPVTAIVAAPQSISVLSPPSVADTKQTIRSSSAEVTHTVTPADVNNDDAPDLRQDAGSVATAHRPWWYVVLAAFGVMVVLGIVALVAWRESPSRPPLATEQRITANPPDAPVTGAVISPDGKYVAYSDPTGVYIRHIDSGETLPLALPKGFAGIPTSWFPDSTHLLLANHEGPQHTAKIWKVSILGGDPQMLLEDADQGVVSPDGSRIAIFRPHLPIRARLPAQELWLADADGQNAHRLVAQEADRTGTTQADMWSASWSPDGQRVAYIQRESVPSNFPNGDKYFLYTRKADGSDAKFVLQNNRMNSVLDEYGQLLPPPLYWAPEGRLYFALQSQPEAATEDYAIWSIAVDQSTGEPQGQPRELLGGLGSIGGFSTSRAGTERRLVFWRSDVSVQVFVSEFNHNTRKMSSPRRLTRDQSVDAAPVDWTADSKAIVFASERNGKHGVYRQKLDETMAESLIQVRQRQAIAPRLSGDGREVLYAQAEKPRDPSAPVSLMAAPIAGGTPRLILSEPGINNVLCAKPPAQMCILKELLGQTALFYLLDLYHGKGCLVAKLSSDANWGFSPDSSTLVIVTNSEEGKVRFVSIESGTTKDVVVQGWPILKGADWAADSKVVLMASVSPKGVPVILGVDTEGNAKVLLEGDRGNPLEWVIPSPDGKYGALAVITGESNVWMVENY